MKRLGNIWPAVISAENGVQAVIDGTRFKRGQKEVRPLFYSREAVEADKTLWHRVDPGKARAYAERLCRELANGTWQHQPPRHRRQFCRNRASSGGKWRDLYIPSLDDHIVAHMVMQASQRAFTRGMHPHCCGSVPGRGIRHVNRYVQKWLRHDKSCRYFVKLDIRRFFDSVDADRLKAILAAKIKDPNVLRTFGQIIDSAPVPCPVGYYTSPWLANLYLEELDWYIEQQLFKRRRGKRIKLVRHALRYVDDIFLAGASKSDLKKAVRAIATWLRDYRGLELKPSWEIKAVGRHELVDGAWKLKPGTYWCDIGGYRFCRDATTLRPGIFLALRRLARKMNRLRRWTRRQCASLNSRLGWASHCDSRRLIETQIIPFVDISKTRRLIANVG